MKILCNLLISIFVGLSNAKADETCSSLFQNRGSEILAILDHESLMVGYPVYRKNIAYSLLNNLKLFLGLHYDKTTKVFDIVKKNSLTKLYDPAQIEKLSGELMMALYGKGRTFDDYFHKSKDERQKESVLRNINETILRQGLLSAWESLGYRPSPTFWAHTKLVLYKLSASRFFSRLQQFPFFAAAKIKISDDLMIKIIQNGYEAHLQEVNFELKKQGWHEDYNTFARIARVTFFSGVLLTQYAITTVENKVEEIQQQITKQLLINQFRSFQIQTYTVKEQKDKIIEEAYQSAKQEFVQKWGEEPTDLEAEQLRAKIISDLFDGGTHEK